MASSQGDVFAAGPLRDLAQHVFFKPSVDRLPAILEEATPAPRFLYGNERALVWVAQADWMHVYAKLRQIISGRQRVLLHVVAVGKQDDIGEGGLILVKTSSRAAKGRATFPSTKAENTCWSPTMREEA